MAPLGRLLLALLAAAAPAAAVPADCRGEGCAAASAEEEDGAALLSLKRAASAATGEPYPSIYQGYNFRPYAAPTQVRPSEETCSKLGVLMMDGYVWPTQPGDVNDLRTWCRVADDQIDNPYYQCEQPLGPDEFGLVTARIDGLVFGGGPYGVETFGNQDNIRNQTKSALSVLLADPSVCAITGNVGFMSQYQTFIETLITELEEEDGTPVRRKPMVLGTPALAAAFSERAFGAKILPEIWPVLSPDEAVLVLTSNYNAFNPADGKSLCKLLRQFGITCPSGVVQEREWCKLRAYVRSALKAKFGIDVPDGEERSSLRTLAELIGSNPSAVLMAHSFISAGWNGIPGYMAVDSTGGFHNTWLTLKSYQGLMNRTFDAAVTRLKKKIVAVIAESTEMAPHSNAIRMAYHVPVWDISTLGICLMRAGKSSNYDRHDKNIATAVLRNAEFAECMMEWYVGIGKIKGPRGKWIPGKLEAKFGTQSDGTLRWFEDTTPPLTAEQLMNLECASGRSNPEAGVPAFKPPIGRLMSVFDVGQPRYFSVNPVCYTTPECKCPATKGGNVTGYPGCRNECGGVGTLCGYYSKRTGNCNVDGKMCSVCGIRGELCSTEQVRRPDSIRSFDCEINTDPGPGVR